MQVYSPYQRNWLLKLNGNLPYYLGECPAPSPNDPSVRNSKPFSTLFDMSVPASLPGFELEDLDNNKMEEVWPAGEEVAANVKNIQSFQFLTIDDTNNCRSLNGFCTPNLDPPNSVQ